MTTELYTEVSTDSTNKIIGIREWAESTLTPEEFQEFQEAETRNIELMQNYESTGLLRREKITHPVYINAFKRNINIGIGVKTILSPGVTVFDIPIDPEFGAWHARYMSDPNVNYSPTIQL